MSSGASLRPDISERREIIAEHQWSDEKVLACLRPSGSPLSKQSALFLPGPVHHADLGRFFLRQAEDLLPHFAAAGGVSRFILQSRDQQSLFTKFRAKFFAFRRESFDEPANLSFADGGRIDEALFLFKFPLATCQFCFGLL